MDIHQTIFASTIALFTIAVYGNVRKLCKRTDLLHHKIDSLLEHTGIDENEIDRIQLKANEKLLRLIKESDKWTAIKLALQSDIDRGQLERLVRSMVEQESNLPGGQGVTLKKKEEQ